jgi:hypothetical protein
MYDFDLVRFGALITAAGVWLFYATWRPERTNRGAHWYWWAAAWVALAFVGATMVIAGLARSFYA